MKNTLKRTLAVMLAVIMTVCAAPLAGFVGLELPSFSMLFATKAEAAGYSGICGDNATWTLDTETGILKISGTGTTYDYMTIATQTPWYKNRSYIQHVLISTGITGIGQENFGFCTNIQSVSIPNTVTKIGEDAFWGCTSLINVSIPDSVTSIGDAAFSNTAYYNTESNWDNGVLYINKHIVDTKSEVVSGDFQVKSGTLTIADKAFYQCKSLRSISIPSSVKAIGIDVFYECTSLEKVTITGNLANIPQYTFYGCSALSEITLPDGLTNIKSSAFAGCSSLYDITIPESVCDLSSSAFKDTGIYNSSENWENNVLYIDDCLICANDSFSGNCSVKEGTRLIADNAFYKKSITSVSFPNSLKIINNAAFYMCTQLKNITIPSAVEQVGGLVFGYSGIEYAEIYNPIIGINQFHGSGLSSVLLGTNVKKICGGAFSSTALEEIFITENVTEINANAFNNCYSLIDISVSSNNPSYSSKDGVLFNKNKTTLVRYPEGNANTEYTIPATVIRIEDYAFDSFMNLRTLRMADSVVYIGEGAFDCSDKMTLEPIQDIYYCGTEEQMKMIEIKPANTLISSSTIHYNAHITTEGPEYSFSPTCTENGEIRKTTVCTICGNVVDEDITVLPALGHQEGEWKIVQKAGCLYYGSKELRCIRVNGSQICNQLIKTEQIEGRMHNWDSGEISQNPSCTEQGAILYICQNTTETDEYDSCDERKLEYTDPLGHDEGEWKITKSPDCLNSGTKQLCCTRSTRSGTCGHVLETETIPAIGHKWDNGAVTVKSTCKTQGVKTYTCQNDSSHKKTEALPLDATNHTGGTYIKNASTANCLDSGYTGDTYCSGCNALLKKGETVAKLGHDMSGWTSNKNATHTRKCQRANGCTYSETGACSFGEWVTTKEATCTEKGSKQRKCTVCGYIETAEIALKAHVAGTAVEENRVEETCTKDGKYEKAVYCSKCKTELSRETVAVPKTGHNWGDWTTVTAPTCEKAGSEKRVCKNDSSHVENNTLAAIGHKWDNGVVTLKPTYDSTGIKTFTCQNDNSHIRTETIPINSRPSNENENIIMDKTVDYDSLTGEAEIRLYASSKGQTIITNARTPLDIVLVLDQSGSMEGNLSAKLKTAATEFTNAIYEDAIKNDIDHRIAMVGFAMQNQYNFGDAYYQYLNTEILTTGGEPIEYNSLSSNEMNLAYKNALVSVNHNGFNPILTTAINNIEAKGATAADLGLDMACKIFSQNENDGTRKRIVVFMTDGVPTYKSDYMAETAENAQAKADLLKNTYDADLYSVGVLSGNGAAKARTFLNSIASVDSEGNAMYYDCSNADKLVEDFEKIATQSTTTVTDFTDITLIDTLSSAFTLTEIQEKNLRISAVKNLGIQNENIIITRFSDGTTEIRIEHITPIEVVVGSEVNYVIDFKFKATANENALIEGSYSTNTDNAGVIVGISDVFENNFAVPNETVENAEGVIYFNVNGITYHIVRVHKGDTVTAPKFTLEGDYTFSGWDIPDEIIFEGGKLVVDSTLSQTEYTVTWNTDSGTVSNVYFAGDIIEIPSVGLNSNGEEFISWDSEVPTIMPGNNLEFSAIYGKHEHSYEEEILVAVSCGTEGKVKYICSCGDNYTQTMHALDHNWTTSATVVEEGSTAYSNVYCINCGESPDETLSYTIKAKNGRKETTYDLKLVDSNNITIQPDGAITISLPIPENMLGARSISIYREEADGTLANLNGVRRGNYIVFTTDHFSNYVLKALFDDEDEAAGASVCVRDPSTTVICYGDSIILHADIDGELPKGYYIKWTADNDRFTIVETSADGRTCTVTPSESGDTVFTATVYDADDNLVSSDEQVMTSKAGFFMKIFAFFKKLFGLTKTIPQVYKNIF